MKQILFFLIGFCLAAIPLKFAYANEIPYQVANPEPLTSAEAKAMDDNSFRVMGICKSGCRDKWMNWINSTDGEYRYAPAEGWSTGYESRLQSVLSFDVPSSSDPGVNKLKGYHVYYYPNERYNVPKIDLYWFDVDVDSITFQQSDSDGDGIPDSQDMYPDDSTPYMVKMVTYFTADGTSNGPHVGEIWVTDRGDYFQVGEIPDTDSPEWKDGFFVPDGTWVDPSTNDGPNIGTPSQTNDPVIDQPEYKTGAPTGDTPEGNEPTGKPGTPSTGSETDNQALHGIQDNTSAIADNTRRQLDYMKDLNKAIQNMDRNLARIGGGTGTGTGTGTESGDNSDVIENDNANRDADQSEANTAESNFNSVSVTDHYAGISGDLVEGQDYELPGELSEEGFISDFFGSNPLIMAFENSGFESSGSTATATLSLGDLGSHQIDLSPLQSGFELAGNLLFGLCSIGALIIVVRG